MTGARVFTTRAIDSTQLPLDGVVRDGRYLVFIDGGVWLNNDTVMRLQVDDHPEPLKELRRLIDLAAKQRASMEEYRKKLR